MFDSWADTSLHLLLLKRFMAKVREQMWAKEIERENVCREWCEKMREREREKERLTSEMPSKISIVP